MRILIFDNYDSFTYNLVHMVQKLGVGEVEVHRNDKITLEEAKRFDKFLLSPGPGIPEEAGLLLPLINEYKTSKSILGVCLGHQAIAQTFGASIENLDEVMHGVATPINIHSSKGLFENISGEMTVGRYHSWVVSRKDIPDELEVTAEDANGQIMAIKHRELDVQGVQFHPESVLTEIGEKIIANWLNA